MEQKRFEELVGKLETYAREKPVAYRRRVVALTLLGDVYLISVLLLLVGIVAISVVYISTLKALAIKLLIIVIPIVWILLRSLWIKVPPPEGIELRAHEVPELFKLIESLRKDLDAPVFHRVLIDGDFNAAVIQRPRLGAFGWYENYLLLGLPLLKTMSIEQFKAVLAHEYGHLAGGHAKLSNWIYRQRLRWSRLLNLIETSGSNADALFRGFLKRYAPYLSAYSFPLARSNEYEADAVAARLTSRDDMARALTAVSTCGNYLSDQYWSNIYKQADHVATPHFAPFAKLSEDFESARTNFPRDEWISQAMQTKTTYDDTHPSLADRLQALKAEPVLAFPDVDKAADSLLGEYAQNIAARLDEKWKANVSGQWQARFEQAKKDRETLDLFEKRLAQDETLTIDEAFHHALLVDSVLEDTDRSIELLRAVHAREATRAEVVYALGVRLLYKTQEEGVAHVEKAIELDPGYEAMGRHAIHVYYAKAERTKEAELAAEKAKAAFETRRLAQEERELIRADDRFIAHGLPAETLDQLVSQLKLISKLRDAFLVQKECKYLPNDKCYVLGFVVDAALFEDKAKLGREVLVAMRTSVEFPYATTMFPVDSANEAFRDRLSCIKDARILDSR
jgi:Zn-dependent protease with chaperone function